MDDRGLPQAYQPLPGTPDRTGVEAPRPQNPYQIAAEVSQAPQEQTPQQDHGVFSSLPYHDYLAKNVKEPWNATDDELTGKHFNNYIDGPIKDLVKARLASANKNISKASLDDRADAITKGMKIERAGDITSNLPALKAHLAGLKPADAAAATASSPTESLGNELTRSMHTGLGMAATAAAGIPTALANVGKAVNPFAPANADVEESAAAQKWQNYFFGLADKESETAAKIPQPGKDIPSRVMGVIGSLPGGIASLGMDKPLDEARKAISEGTDLDEVKKNLAIDAAKSLILSKVPGGSLLARGAKGAALNPILDNATALLKGQQTPDAVDNLLSAVFGAGFAGVLGRRPGEAAKPSGAGTPEVKPGATPPGGVDADALAASVAGNKGAIDPSKFVDPKTGLPAQAPLHEDHLSALNEEALGGDALLGVKTPEQAQQYIDTFAKDYSVPPEQMGALTDAVNAHLRDAHGDEAPQAKPIQAQAPTEPAAVQENQATPSEATPAAPIAPEPAKPEVPKLPPSISRAKPKYGLDSVGFDSDIDKALYIVGGPNKSRAHNDYVDWLKNDVGLTGKQIVDMSARVKAAVKDASRTNRNPTGSATDFDLPTVKHPELVPKPSEQAAPTSAAVEPSAAAGTAPEPSNSPVTGAVEPPPVASKPRVRVNPLTGRIEPVVKLRSKYNPLTGKVEPKFKMTELPARGSKGPKA